MHQLSNQQQNRRQPKADVYGCPIELADRLAFPYNAIRSQTVSAIQDRGETGFSADWPAFERLITLTSINIALFDVIEN